MKLRRRPVKVVSAGAVVFRVPGAKQGSAREYLLLHNVKGHWDFPKGKVDPGETVMQAMRREIREESGIGSLRVLRGFRRVLHWRYEYRGKTVAKTAVYRVAATGKSAIRLSREHRAGGWFPYREARRKLKFANARALLAAAERFLARRSGPGTPS